MKKQFFGFVVLVSFALGVAAQKPDVTEANLRKHIMYLASDALEGRRTGEKGSTVAAGYIANQFAKLRLKPGARSKNGKGNYLQPFPYVTGVVMAREGNSFTLDIVRDGTRMKVENGVQVKPVGFSPNAKIADAKVVLAGYGISS